MIYGYIYIFMYTKTNPLALLEYAALMAIGDTSSYSAKKDLQKSASN